MVWSAIQGRQEKTQQPSPFLSRTESFTRVRPKGLVITRPFPLFYRSFQLADHPRDNFAFCVRVGAFRYLDFQVREVRVSSSVVCGLFLSLLIVCESARELLISPRRERPRLSEIPRCFPIPVLSPRLSETPQPERGAGRDSAVIGLHNSLESLGETFRVALQWSGRNSMAPLGGEQRYPPQVQASAESDQVICIRMSRVES
ncbi:hypothetical protein DEO72_LG5g1925 [Vigna unguiculata]|uniref:Uncharacterized protein n=1 Tax=Vigna unguiculata TaxID=3917 RepID=A0A4D6LXX1_VIGUN|nr:hypothetical protein DEO72_LG5g1925 [Vigna unguiculata]